MVGATNSIEVGLDLIKSLRPNVVFLDVILDSNYLFELLNKIEFNLPKFIFISSDNAYSYTAFQYNAVDFISKPIDFTSLILSIYKSIKLIEMERVYQDYKVNSVNSINQNIDYIAISSQEKIDLIQMQDIIYCQADGKYTIFHLINGRKITSSRNLGEYNTILDSNYFFRIHHSYVINLKHVIKISKRDGYYCELIGKIILPIAKRRQDDFNKFIKLKE